MKIGYARVSTKDQNLDMQLDALKVAGCERIFADKFTGTSRKRPKLEQMLKALAHGDEVILYSLDRLARSNRDLFNLADEIKEIGANFRSLSEPWADTTTPAGELVFTIFAGLAEFERKRLLKRTQEGRAAAKKRGVHLGRKPKLNDSQIAEVVKMREQGRPVKEIADLFNVHRATIYTVLKE